MDQPTASPLRQLLDLKLDGKLDERVKQLQEEGLGFRLIARQLFADTDVSVSYEVLRKWYGRDEEAAS
jgi:intein-encoded DNA endonuclease-like protein